MQDIKAPDADDKLMNDIFPIVLLNLTQMSYMHLRQWRLGNLH
jgi:hypothetical protein